MVIVHLLSSGYYDAYYKKAQQVRTLIVEDFERAFGNYDFLIGPTAPTTAFKLGDRAADPLQMYMSDLMTVGVSLAGLPAVSLPVESAGDLPVGLQVIGKFGSDDKLLQVAAAIEELYR